MVYRVIDPVERSEEIDHTKGKACDKRFPAVLFPEREKKRHETDPCQNREIKARKSQRQQNTWCQRRQKRIIFFQISIFHILTIKKRNRYSYCPGAVSSVGRARVWKTRCPQFNSATAHHDFIGLPAESQDEKPVLPILRTPPKVSRADTHTGEGLALQLRSMAQAIKTKYRHIPIMNK